MPYNIVCKYLPCSTVSALMNTETQYSPASYYTRILRCAIRYSRTPLSWMVKIGSGLSETAKHPGEGNG